MSLKDKSMADLREIVRRDPLWRAKAWAEITYRNRFRQDMDRENGVHNRGATSFVASLQKPGLSPDAARALIHEYRAMSPRTTAIWTDLGVKPWVPPDLSEPEPPREGPMV